LRDSFDCFYYLVG